MPTPDLLDALEIESAPSPTAAVIWLHGLGADGHDFETIVPYLGLEGLGVRFVFPHAPRRAVTLNMGLIMRAWYDIRGLNVGSDPDAKGIGESVTQVTALVDRERGRGIDAGRIVLAGFSQGGVIALHVALRYPETLAGVVALSTYLPEARALETEASAANQRIPIFQGHGEYDAMIPPELGEQARDRLQALGHPVAWKTYPMQHEVHPDEIADLGDWLRGRLADAPGSAPLSAPAPEGGNH
jgi:phospholipase/carboxylesterase